MHPLEAKLSQSWPLLHWQDVTTVLAVSGGPDSVALLRAMVAIKTAGAGRLVVAHFNHRLREQSDADAEFVAALCDELHLECDVQSANRDLRQRGGGNGLESLAREYRYRFLEQAAKRHGARHVVVAHTADDQAETVLHRILRGTGISGLAGIPRVRPLNLDVAIMRPMLDIRRQEVLQYLESIGQAFCQDRSNRDIALTRNRIRHELLPHLTQTYNQRVTDALLRLAQHALDAQGVIDRLAQAEMDQWVQFLPGGLVEIPCARFAALDPFLQRELLISVWKRQAWPLQSMGASKWDELAQLVNRRSKGSSIGRRSFPGNILADRQPNSLSLRRATGVAS